MRTSAEWLAHVAQAREGAAATRPRASLLAAASALAVVGLACGPSGPGGSPVDVVLGGGASAATSSSPRAGSQSPPPERRCDDALAGFRARAAAVGEEASFDAVLPEERRRCREALSTSPHRAKCEAIGLLADYESCVLHCIRTVGVEPPYAPGDVLDNCEGPCAQSYECR